MNSFYTQKQHALMFIILLRLLKFEANNLEVSLTSCSVTSLSSSAVRKIKSKALTLITQ